MRDQFETSGKIIVTDPCYNVNSCNAVVAVLAGKWDVEVNTDKNDNHVMCIEAYHIDHKHSGSWSEYSKNIGVDSGQVGFFDLDHYQDNTIVPPIEKWSDPETIIEEKNPWYSYCCDITLNELAGELPYGFVSSSGYGDGCYSLEAKYDKNNIIVGLRVTFIEEEEETYDCPHCGCSYDFEDEADSCCDDE